MAIHGAVLPTGKVLWFSYPKNPTPRFGGAGAPNTAQAWLWDPATGTNRQVDPPLWRDPADGQLKPANIWCAGQSHMADGRLLVTGGNLAYSTDTKGFKGLNKVYTFNPFNETWTEQPDMRRGRWYPTNVLLPDGRTAIFSGYDESGDYVTNNDIELFTPSPDLNGRGTLTQLDVRNTAGATPPVGGLYPHMFVMPSGRTLTAGPYPTDSWYLNGPGSGGAFSWADAPNASRDRLWGSGVLVPGGTSGSTRVMQLGGSITSSSISGADTEVFDETGGGWQPAPSMHVGRGHLNTVLLPDGSMVSVGGGVGSRDANQWAADPEQRHIELWDPATGNWTLGPQQAESRAYHSIAMLLPDGRVISAGDDVNGGIDKDTAEIYEPPYLFKGPRPTISSAPSGVQLNTTFDVNTPNTNITRAALVAPSATTHANDMSQRYVPLTVTQRPGGVTLTSPATGAIAPHGYYMLFLINNQGIPSTAKFIQLGADPVAPPEDKPIVSAGVTVVRGPLSDAAANALFKKIDETKEAGRGPGGSLVPRKQCTIVGTSGSDRVKGTTGNDVICGLGGNDVLDGAGGIDIIDGARGADRLTGAGGKDKLIGLAGDDRETGGSGRDELGAGKGSDRLTGGDGRDQLHGGSGSDALSARDRSRDRVDGGTGRDRARVDRLGRAPRRARGVRRIDSVRRVEQLF